MAAVAFTHKAVQNARLDYRDPEFELIAEGYKRSNSPVEREQPVTTPMLLEMRNRLGSLDEQGCFLWGSIVLAFFFLDSSSELWGPVSVDNSTDNNRTHCVKADNVILRNRQGDQGSPRGDDVHSVEVLFESHKGDRTAQGVAIRHYRSEHQVLCPVVAAQECLQIRENWTAASVALGPYLTSTSRRGTIKKTTVTKFIKEAARGLGLSPQDYSCHSLRIGGACALSGGREE